MTTEVRVTGLTEARAALERGRSVIVVAPPALEHAEIVWELLPGTLGSRPTSVIVCADPVAAAEWAEGAPAGRRIHSVTGLARSARVLQSNPPEIAAGAAKDVAALVGRSALKLGAVHTVVVAWPEALLAEHGELLDALLAEAPEARRLVLTWAPGRIEGFLERHAFRAPMVGTPPVDDAGRPAAPLGPARFAVAPRDRRPAAVRAALDALNVARCLVWQRRLDLPRESVDAVLCVDLPSREEFAQLSRLGEPLLLLSAAQLPYARSLASPLKPFTLPSAADRARDRAEALRADVTQVLEQGNVDAELALLDPLFADYDPAQVAAALLAIHRQPSAGSAGPAPTDAHRPTRVKIFVNVGKKDRASAKDLVGALIREAGLKKEEIGRVDVRESFALVELASGVVEQALGGLAGATIRGRRVTARRERSS